MLARRPKTLKLRPWLPAVFLFFGLSPLSGQTRSTTPATVASASPALTVSSGEHLVLELDDSLNTRTNLKGDHVHFTTLREVVVGYQTAIPAGSSVRATLAQVRKPGRGGRPGQMAFAFEELVLTDGTTLPFSANLVRAGFTTLSKDGTKVKGESGRSKRDLMVIAAGAGQGAIVGASVGGGKGAAYGGAIGAGIGLLSIWLQKGPHLDLPRGMLFEVELNDPVEVPHASVVRFAQRTAPPVSQPGAPPPSASASTSAGGFRFPDEGAPSRPEEPIPDFDDEPETAQESAGDAQEESVEVASNRQPLPPPGAPTEAPPGPPPPELDPNLGDPGGYKLSVDVRMVMVEAFVRDERDRVMEDLTREDFRLLEDGVEQEIRHFSRDELPLAVALVVDRSGSVAPYMPELRRAAYDTLSQLKRGDQVALFAFASTVDRLEDLTTDRRRIAERISRIRAGGGTNIADALQLATQYLALAAPYQRRIVVLISDNQETTHGHTSQGRLIRQALETETVIYSVKTPGERSSLVLRLPNWMGGPSSVNKITEETGGEVIDVRRVGSLEAALSTVITRIKTRYTLGYQSTNKARDGAFRQIEVQLVDRYGRPGRDYSVYARRGYYAPDERVASDPAPATTP